VPDASATGPVVSRYEDSSRTVSRDNGVSVALSNGDTLWIFGDSSIYGINTGGQASLASVVTGSTAVVGPYGAGQLPTSLLELPSPGQRLKLSSRNPPSRFVPAPTNIYLPDGSGGLCTASGARFAARWPTGAAVIPGTADVLVTYVDVCISGAWDFRFEGWGFMEYNWQTNTLDVPPYDVFAPDPSGSALPATLQLGNPVIANGQVTLFSSICTSSYVGCFAGQVYMTTVAMNLTALRNPASYQVAAAPTDAAWLPLGISVAAYPDAPLRLIENTSIVGDYRVFVATSPTGPWHLDSTGTLGACTSFNVGFCYQFKGHPELSTTSQLVISYYQPDAGPSGPNGPVGHLMATGVSHSVTTLRPSTTAVSSSQNPSTSGQSVTFTATVTPTSGIGTPSGTVQFKDGSANLGAAQTLNGSGQAGLTTSSLSQGAHSITAAYSGDNTFAGSTSSPFSQTMNAGTLSAAVVVPSNGATLSGTTTLSAAASGPVVRVEFRITGGVYSNAVLGTATNSPYGWIYNWNTLTVGDGAYTLAARAFDASNNTAVSPSINVTVKNMSTSVAVPSNGATLSGTTTLSAAASGPVVGVEFRITGGIYSNLLLGPATSSPWGWIYNWNTTTVANGSYTLQSRALDNKGGSTYSAGVTITVAN